MKKAEHAELGGRLVECRAILNEVRQWEQYPKGMLRTERALLTKLRKRLEARLVRHEALMELEDDEQQEARGETET